MSEIRRKIIENGTIPLMTDEGIFRFVEYSIDKFKNGGTYDASREVIVNGGVSCANKDEIIPDREIFASGCRLMSIFINQIKNEKDMSIVRKFIFERMGINTSRMTDDEIVEMLNYPLDKVVDAMAARRYNEIPSVFVNMLLEGGRFCMIPSDDTIGEKINTDFRMYINLPNNRDSLRFWETFQRKCIERGVPYKMKINTDEDTLDRTIIYAKKEDVDDVLNILDEIEREMPEVISQFGKPISTGLNYSYYAFTEDPVHNMTYNQLFNRMGQRVMACCMAEYIMEDIEFIAGLTPAEREALAKVADPATFTSEIEDKRKNNAVEGKVPCIGIYTVPEVVMNIIKKYAQTHNMNDEHMRNMVEERLIHFMTLINGTDMNKPICLDNRFYEGMEGEMSSSAAPRKPVGPRPAHTTTPAKTTSATPPRRVPVQPARTLPKRKPMTPQERSEFLRDFEYDLHDLFMDYLQASLKDPAGATEILLAKLADLKGKYMVAAGLETGFRNTRKYADVMKTFAKLVSFKPYQNDPTKGDMINRGLKRQYYAAMYETLRPEVRRLALSVIDVKD